MLANDEPHSPRSPRSESDLESAWAARVEPTVSHCLTWLITQAWQATSQDAHALMARVSAHLVIIGLVLLAVVLSSVRLPGRAWSSASLPSVPAPAATLGNRVTHASLAARGGPRFIGDDSQIVRMAAPLTPNINRPRKDVISYTVQAGDSLFGIAQAFNLRPESVLWANPELKDNPDLLSVGAEIAIPPVDGVLHTVQKGDTLDGLARKYKVTPEAIAAATWNHLLPGQELPVGQTLVVPGGKREAVVWQLPVTTQAPTSRGAGGWTNAGQCVGETAKPIGTGQFIWPSNVHWISGNPYTWWHQGIDLAGNLGDPVYASDTGTVIWAGPNSWGYGNMVMLDHGNGWQTLYSHLSQVYVRCGQQILQGAQIGAVGSSGNSTGPHLHFETRLNGTLPNPLDRLPRP